MTEAKILTLDEVAEIEARERLATPPPWECGPSYRFIGAKKASEHPLGGSAICNPNDNNGARLYPTNRKNNADFMAHAREDIPALCATVRQLVEENEKLKLSEEELRILTDHHYYEADKAITRRGDRLSQHRHLERLGVLREQLK